jgi:HSP20 family protein
MALMRWDPFRDLMRERMGNLMGKDWKTPMATVMWSPSVDIFENDNEIVIKAELPGMAAKDIDIKLENNVLMLRGERRFEKEAKEENYHRIEREYGSFSRSFSLPVAVDNDKVTAEYKDGVLRVVLSKKEEIKSKPIKIAAA